MVVKVERTCPRCRARLYHWVVQRFVRAGAAVRLQCAACAHRWLGRLKPVELHNFGDRMPP